MEIYNQNVDTRISQQMETTQTNETVNEQIQHKTMVLSELIAPVDVIFTFNNDEKHKIIVTHVSRPQNICFQLTQNRESLNNLMYKMQNHFNNVNLAEIILPDNLLIASNLCAAKFATDNHWYRCQIIDIDDDGQVYIHFIDFGGEELESAHNLYILPEQFIKLPKQAINARLSNVEIVSHQFHKVTRNILDICEEYNLLAEIRGMIGEDFCVELYRENDDESLNNRIVSEGSVKRISDNDKDGVTFFVKIKLKFFNLKY
jgi:hypothetical protein